MFFADKSDLTFLLLCCDTALPSSNEKKCNRKSLEKEPSLLVLRKYVLGYCSWICGFSDSLRRFFNCILLLNLITLYSHNTFWFTMYKFILSYPVKHMLYVLYYIICINLSFNNANILTPLRPIPDVPHIIWKWKEVL